jgi:hypothetical protein
MWVDIQVDIRAGDGGGAFVPDNDRLQLGRMRILCGSGARAEHQPEHDAHDQRDCDFHRPSGLRWPIRLPAD